METLEEFIQTNRDPRELKRALAVQMSQRGHSYREIRDVLQVSIGFVTTCSQRYEAALGRIEIELLGNSGVSEERTEAGTVQLVSPKGCLDDRGGGRPC